MEGLAQLLNSIAERAFYYAILGLIFSGILMIGNYFGFSIPPDVVAWLNVAFAFFLSLCLVEGGRRLIAMVQAARAAVDEENDALRNISALYKEEAQALWSLLGPDAPPRFHVQDGSLAFSLMQKGILRPVKSIGYATFICEVHPAIAARRDELRQTLPPKEG